MKQLLKSLPTRGGWIEIPAAVRDAIDQNPSLPTRGGWIEIRRKRMEGRKMSVPPHTGRVD